MKGGLDKLGGFDREVLWTGQIPTHSEIADGLNSTRRRIERVGVSGATHVILSGPNRGLHVAVDAWEKRKRSIRSDRSLVVRCIFADGPNKGNTARLKMLVLKEI